MLIVGAFGTGPTLACELARRGVSFRLVEAAAPLASVDRAARASSRARWRCSTISASGERVIAHGRMAMPIRSTRVDGEATLGATEPEALKDRPDIPYTTSPITPEWRTEEALRLRLADLGGVVEFGTVLERFEQSDETVSAALASGGETETVTAQWLIGCDGGHSVVRAQAGVAFAGETREELRMIVADLGVDGLDRDVWHMWQHPGRPACPVPASVHQRVPAPGPDPRPDRTPH